MFDFNSISSEQKKGYLRTAGLQQGAKFVKLEYIANENWEAFDIELETADGKVFTERTFGPNIDKVYPKAKWENGVQVGMETKEEALARVEDETAAKLFHLASCFATKQTIVEKVKTCTTFKEMVDKINAVINGAGSAKNTPLNFLTTWKNSPTKQKSNLIIAERITWIEPTKQTPEGTNLPAGITLTSYQKNNMMIEKFPYGGQTAPATTGANDMPF